MLQVICLVRLKGPQATFHGNLDKPAVKCEVNKERTASIPKLADMTKKTINLLKTNKNGFSYRLRELQSISRLIRTILAVSLGETMDLDEAVQVALDFAKKDGNTLCYRKQLIMLTQPRLFTQMQRLQALHRLLLPLMVHL